MPKKSQFDKWFLVQFGGHPDKNRELHVIREDIYCAKVKLATLQGELAWAESIEAEYRAASYARNAAGKKFKF